MRINIWIFSIGVLCGLGGCDDSAKGCAPVAFCDGNADNLFVFRISTDYFNVAIGERTQVENGYVLLIVDGQCNYWVYDRRYNNTTGELRMWSKMRTGQLTDDQEEMFSKDMCLDKMEDLAGNNYPADVADPGYTFISYKGKGFRCVAGGCDGKETVGEIRDNAFAWLDDLLAEGAPVDGGLRATAIIIPPEQMEIVNGLTLQPAPDSFDIASMAKTVADAEADCYGAGVNLEGDFVPELKSLQDAYLNGDYGDWYYQFIPMQDTDGTVYMLYFRDECLHEDAQGLLREEPYDAGECVSL
jgi:hypothetical protein